MYESSHLSHATLDALFEGRLSDEEILACESHMDQCTGCSALAEEHLHQLEAPVFDEQLPLMQLLEETTKSIDWKAFQVQLDEQLQLVPKAESSYCTTEFPSEIAAPQPPQPSLWTQMLSWVREHPGLMLASFATAAVLLLFFLVPQIDPGPKPNAGLAEIEGIFKEEKTAQISITQSRNKKTGKPMTVIDVKEPPLVGQPLHDPSDVTPRKRVPQPKKR